MGLKVIGSGLGRTGTMSLKAALETLLGGKCYHMYEVFEHMDHVPMWHAAAKGEAVDWDQLFDAFVAGVDWPVGAFWPELAAKYPDALVLQSERPSEDWWRSASNTIFRAIDGEMPPHMHDWKQMIDAMMASRFTPNLQDREACIAAYERHNALVKETVPVERLLVWHPGDGWEPICERLGVAVPDEPFPHTNTTEEFNKRREAVAAE